MKCDLDVQFIRGKKSNWKYTFLSLLPQNYLDSGFDYLERQ